MDIPTQAPPRVVHLELHTYDRQTASRFYADMLGWRSKQITSPWGTYHALLIGDGLGGGVVECGTPEPRWLPYVAVDRIEPATERAQDLGATVLLGPNEGPSGWRSVLSTPTGGEIALWQQKR